MILRRLLVFVLATMAISHCPVCANAQECDTILSVDSTDEKYFSFSDLLSSITLNPILFRVTPVLAQGVGLGESIQNGCASFNWWGMQVDGDDGSFSFKWETFVPKAPGISNCIKAALNDDLRCLVPSIKPCKPMPIEKIAYHGGSAGAYVFHVGVGPYTRKIRKSSYYTCRNVIIENSSSIPIELPVSISGNAFAAVSFGWTKRTYGEATLEITGSVGGQALSGQAHAKAVTGDILGVEDSINLTRRFLVAPGSGRYTIHIDITARATVDVQAKSAGLAGVLSDAATATIDFPNSVDIGNFTGPNGSALPAGVRIYDDMDGSLYADTRVFPGLPNLQTTATLSRDSITNEVIADINVKNAGPGEAQNVQLTGAELNSYTSSTALPQVVGRLIPELPASLATRTFRFPASVGTRGTRTLLRINGTRNGGSFGGAFRVTLP